MFIKAVRLYNSKRVSFLVDPSNKFSTEYSTSCMLGVNVFLYNIATDDVDEALSAVDVHLQYMADDWAVKDFEIWEVKTQGYLVPANKIYIPALNDLNTYPNTYDFEAVLQHNLFSKKEQITSLGKNKILFCNAAGKNHMYIAQKIKLFRCLKKYIDNHPVLCTP